MKRSGKIVSLFLAVCLMIGMMPAMQTQAATTQQVTAQTTVDKSTIYDDEAATFELSVTGKKVPGQVVPNDVVLVMDCSGSMSSEGKFAQMQNAAKTFIDLLNSTQHRVGLVSYSSGVNSFDITDDVNASKAWVDSMVVGGSTYTDKGIKKAEEMLNQQKRPEAKAAIVVLSDGAATDKAAAKAAADVAKDPNGSNITIYTVALLDNAVASDPEKAKKSDANQNMIKIATSEAHHHYVGAQNVVGVYEEIASQIGEANVGDVTITQEIAPQFELVPGSADQSIPQPTISDNTMTWKINDLREQTVHLQYQLRAKAGTPSGTYSHISSGEITYLTFDGQTQNIAVPVQQISLYYTPVINSVSQTDFETTGGEAVTVKGSGFESGSVVKIGSSTIKTATVVDANTITFTMPAHAQGSADLSITNPGGKVATVPVRFLANPVATGISPTSGAYEGNTKVQINCTNVMSGATVTFDGQAGTVTSISSNRVYVLTPPANKEGTVDVVITNPDGTSLTLPDAYTYNAPLPGPEITVTGVSPSSSVEGTEQKAYVTGTLMDHVIGIQVGGVDAQIVSQSTNRAYFYVPTTLAAGTYDVAVSDDYGNTKTLTAAYTVTAKPVEPSFTITGITPATSMEGKTQQVTISGTKLTDTATVRVAGKDITPDSTAEKSVVATIPSTLAVGVYDVVVVDSKGHEETLKDAYEVTAKPTSAAFELTGVSPANSEEGATKKAYVSGTSMNEVKKIQVGGVDAELVSTSTNRAYFYVPTSLTVGVYDIVCADEYGNTKTLAAAYTIDPKPVEPPFTVTSVSPATSVEGKEQQITIAGTKLSDTALVRLGSTDITPDSVAATSVKATVPSTVAPGTYDITVIDSSNQAETLASAYTVTPKPTEASFELKGISVNTSVEEETKKVYVSGTSMTKVTGVQVGGKDAELVSTSSNRAYFYIPKTLTAGTYDVTCFDEYGNSKTLASAYTITPKPVEPPFTVTSVSPATSVEGKTHQITISGTKLGNTTKVQLGTTEITVDSVSASSVKATVPSTVAPGTYDIVLTDNNANQESLANGYVVTPKPAVAEFTLTGVSPATSMAGATQKSYVSGTSMTLVKGVKVGGKDAELVSTSTNRVYFYVPKDLGEGVYDVVCYDEYGNEKTLSSAYTITKNTQSSASTITLTKVSVSSTTTGSKIYVGGSGFKTGATVKVGGVSATVKSVSSNRVYFLVPTSLSAGTYDVTVTNADGGTATLSSALTVK